MVMVMDHVTGIVTEKSCGVQTFHAYIIAEVGRLTDAMQASDDATVLVQHLFLDELRKQLAPTLRLVRDLRMMSNCRFLWRRLENLDEATCEDLVPVVARVGCMNLALAFVGCIGTFIHYKVWRHLKDNKVVGLEMRRFEQTYRDFQKKMKVLENDKHHKDAKKRAYQAAIENMHANALNKEEIKEFDAGEKKDHQ